MAKRLPPLNPLRAFEAAARHLSMSRAAAELNVTHGAVSHQVRALERTLKTALFIRDGNALKLSPQGEALLPRVTAAFTSITDAVAELTQPVAEGDLAIACLPSLMTFWLLPRLNRFAQRHPGVRLKLIATNDKRRVRSQDADVWITYGVEAWPNRDWKLWFEPSLFPVCSPALINTRPIRTTDDLRGHTLLHADGGREWNTWLNAAGLPELTIGSRHQMSDANLATLAAIYGHGIALCDSLTGVDLLAEGRLVVPIDLKISAPEAFYVVYRRELGRSPLMRTFIDWLFAETHAHRPLPDFSTLKSQAPRQPRKRQV
ncbi:transcriptional regulator GcvA [Taklimakanibacter deserti]|uniref:transcriptional regulator GcvA n=1 Tax=Taklimakanibacter deserti TaxID=2267839 RepID=UPI000E6533CB